MPKNFVLALAALLGTIIGAGVFALPYVVFKAGWLTALFYFLLLVPVICLLHLFLGQVVLSTKGQHRLAGYAQIYLGRTAKRITGLATVLGTIGALLAYLILSGQFLKLIFPVGLSAGQLSIALWALMSVLVFLGLKSIAKTELFLTVGLFLVVLIIFGFALPKVEAVNLSLVNRQFLFLPFGVLMFSLVGWSAVPGISGLLKKKKNLKKVILAGLIISAVFYFIFGVIISGVSGPQTSPEAFQGLKPFLGSKIIILGGLFGLLSVISSFLILANYLKNTLFLDYHWPKFLSFFLAVFSPLALFLLGLRNFITVVGVVGTFVGLIEGAVIALAYQKAKKQPQAKPAYVLEVPNLFIYFVIVILALGAFSQIIYYF